MKALKSCMLAAAFTTTTALTAFAGELTIATVNNGHMVEMQKFTPEFEKANPGIKLCLLYTSPSPRDQRGSRMPSSA